MADQFNEAWISLTRLCGTNYRRPITRKGKSIFVPNPQRPEQTYRIDASTFDAGKGQGRGSWWILPWTDEATKVTERERNWQT